MVTVRGLYELMAYFDDGKELSILDFGTPPFEKEENRELYESMSRDVEKVLQIEHRAAKFSIANLMTCKKVCILSGTTGDLKCFKKKLEDIVTDSRIRFEIRDFILPTWLQQTEQ